MKVLFIQSNFYMSKIQNNVCCICIIVLLQCSVGLNYACSDFFGRFNVQFLGFGKFKVRLSWILTNVWQVHLAKLVYSKFNIKIFFEFGKVSKFDKTKIWRVQ